MLLEHRDNNRKFSDLKKQQSEKLEAKKNGRLYHDAENIEAALKTME